MAPVPRGVDLAGLRAAAVDCRGCALWDGPTQTVFGEGPPDAQLVLVGEAPGDVEDRRGRPFVGPAGVLLTRALRDVGVERETVYVTNAVKHFRFTLPEPGKRRIHATPGPEHVAACRPWLAAELNQIRPSVVVLLGATACTALLGPQVRVTRWRGRLMDGPPGSEAKLVPTVHPSALLRMPDADREAAYEAFVSDLAVAVKACSKAAR
ncbi:MAG: UdgX family uracil-DNA binding protein [Mycobacteriales bacterium]